MKKNQAYSFNPVSDEDRRKASRIVADLMRDHSALKVAALFDLPYAYVFFIKNLQRHSGGKGEGYQAPKWSIKKVNQYGAMLGFRRQKNVLDDMAS